MQEAPPLTSTQPKARGILVIGGIKGAAQPQGVCAAPPLTRNPSRVWKAHATETMEAAAAMVGEGRDGLCWR